MQPQRLAPHRPLFAAAAAVWLMGALWWSWRLSAAGDAPGLLPPIELHALLLGLGFMPLFIAGFAFTAPPRWLGLVPPAGPVFVIPALLAVCGWALLIGGELLQRPALPGLGLLAAGLTQLGCAGALLRLCLQPQARRSPHALGLVAGMTLIGLSLLLAAGAPLDAARLRLATLLGLDCGVAGVFALALQRLTPFLHAHGRRAGGLFALLLAGLALRALLALAPPVPALAPLRWAALPFGVVLAALLLRDAWQPALAQARRMPLIAQLHLGYQWLAIALALQGLAGAGLIDEALPRHALYLGFMGTTLLAMAGRVTAVQQRRSVAVDGPLRAMQALLQLLTLTRLAAALWPAAALLPLAAGGFAVLAAGWGLRYGPWLWRGPEPGHHRRTPT